MSYVRVKRARGGASVPCPSCSGATHVIKTRRVAGRVERRRQCTSCGHQFRTRERVHVVPAVEDRPR